MLKGAVLLTKAKENIKTVERTSYVMWFQKVNKKELLKKAQNKTKCKCSRNLPLRIEAADLQPPFITLRSLGVNKWVWIIGVFVSLRSSACEYLHTLVNLKQRQPQFQILYSSFINHIFCTLYFSRSSLFYLLITLFISFLWCDVKLKPRTFLTN